MNEDPLVSIIVISYNQAKYIRTNLDSIKSQTFENIELILADDASSDNSVEIFSQWLSENGYTAKTNYHRVNTGLATVLNECVDMATGKYIKLIAADDFLHVESISKCVEKLEELGENYGLVSSDTFCIDENGNLQEDFRDFNSIQNIPPEQMHDVLIKGNRLATLTVLMRTDVLRETGKYKAEFLVEDYQRWLMISKRYFIAYIPEKLAYYRVHPENISKTRAEQILREDRILQMMFDHKGIVKQQINDFMHWSYVWKKPISKEMLQLYSKYPFHNKTLKFFIQFKTPAILFKILFSLSRRMNFSLP